MGGDWIDLKCADGATATVRSKAVTAVVGDAQHCEVRLVADPHPLHVSMGRESVVRIVQEAEGEA